MMCSFTRLLSLGSLIFSVGLVSADSSELSKPVFSVSYSAHQAHKGPDLRITPDGNPGNQRVVLDFLEGNQQVSGFQLDVRFHAEQELTIDISSCAAGLPKTHQGFCREIEKNVVRILVDSALNDVLQSSNIGILRAEGAPFTVEIIESSVVAGDSMGVKVDVEVL